MDNEKYRYNHLGIPTTIPKENEVYLEKFKMYVCGYEQNSFNIEWMRFEEDCPLPMLVQTVPHVAFEVDNLQEAIRHKKIIIAPNEPSNGVVVAFIEENGAPIEIMQFGKKKP